MSLRLLFNLSFDKDLRFHMNDCGLISQLVEILKIPGYRSFVLKILYNLSVEDKIKAVFTYTECVPLVF